MNISEEDLSIYAGGQIWAHDKKGGLYRIAGIKAMRVVPVNRSSYNLEIMLLWLYFKARDRWPKPTDTPFPISYKKPMVISGIEDWEYVPRESADGVDRLVNPDSSLEIALYRPGGSSFEPLW